MLSMVSFWGAAADMTAFEVFDGRDALREGPVGSIETPDDERLAEAHIFERALQLGSVPLRVGHCLFVNLVVPGPH